MPYRALAVDYDGTLASGGRVAPATLAALDRLRPAGHRLFLVTGRRLDDLRSAFPEADRLCDAMVCENGGVLHLPATGETRALAPPPPPELLDCLRRKGVQPLAIGTVALYTRTPHEKEAIDAIRELALTLDVSFNKGAVMILPPGRDKARTLGELLREAGIAPAEVVGVGDAENDHAFFRMCGLSVAVGNALPAVKSAADLVLGAPRGAGVRQLIDWMMADDLAGVTPKADNHL